MMNQSRQLQQQTIKRKMPIDNINQWQFQVRPTTQPVPDIINERQTNQREQYNQNSKILQPP
jgi:hypothetical protein